MRTRFKRLQSSFNDRITEVHLSFYKAVLACFNVLPSICKLYDSQQSFMSKLSPQFIKPNVIKHHKDLVNSFSSLPLDTDGFLDDGDTGQKDPDKFF